METGIFHLFLSQINYQQALPFKMLSCTSSSLYQIRSIKSLGIVRREEAEERGPPRRPASTPDNVSSLRWGPSASHQRSRRPSSPAWLHLSRPQPQRFLLCALLQTNVVPWHRHVTWMSLSLRDRLGPPLPSWEPPQLTNYISQFSPLKNDKAMREAGKWGRLTIRSKDQRQRAWERVRGPRLRPLRLPGKSARDACSLPIKCSSSELTGAGCAPGNPEALARPITRPVRDLLTEIRWGSDRFRKVKFAIY